MPRLPLVTIADVSDTYHESYRLAIGRSSGLTTTIQTLFCKPRLAELLDGVHAAGSVFLGPWAPESVGDYCSGTNHVLPTYGFARSYSSLGVTDFLRSMTVQSLTAEGLRNVGPIAERLAALEGLDAHGRAVRERLDALDAKSNGMDLG